jgi:hypothetical protein
VRETDIFRPRKSCSGPEGTNAGTDRCGHGARRLKAGAVSIVSWTRCGNEQNKRPEFLEWFILRGRKVVRVIFLR